MALTIGMTGMDRTTEAKVQAAFKVANAESGHRWVFVNDEEEADYVIVDMDSLYGPMSWLRLHAAGRKVIGLTSVDRSQTDYRLPSPVEAGQLAVLLSEIATDAPAGDAEIPARPEAPAPEPYAAPSPEIEPEPKPEPEAVAPPIPAPEPEPEPAPAPEPEPAPQPEPEPAIEVPADRGLRQWLEPNGLEHRVRLQRDGQPTLLIDPRRRVWHGPAALKPVAACFEGTLAIEDFETPDAQAWETEAASIGAAQPLSRLQWLGGLVSGHGALLPGLDPDGADRLGKWPQTEREYPKHFRIATAMMKGPATVAAIAEASGVAREDVADFINANLATGYAQFVPPVAPEPELPPQKPAGGLFGRIRGR